MAGSGLIALLDDIATIADDVATMTIAATHKASGIVTDDLAVTAEQAIGIRRERELPVIFEVAKGSLRNKALFLVPGALALSFFAPWSITPLLVLGGCWLCFEASEKVLHKITHVSGDEPEDAGPAVTDPEGYERSRVSGAIKTDFVLSAEIVAISLGEVAAAPFLQQVMTLYTISVVMVIGVYGLVAALVRMDDVGEALALRGGHTASLGRAIVLAAPKVLTSISWVGVFAMWMVGGHLLIGGIPPLHHAVEHAAEGRAAWLLSALMGIGVGAVLGAILVAAAALFRRIKGGRAPH